MRRRPQWLHAMPIAIALAALAFAPVANARKLQMSGTWAIRRGGVFVPLQFAQTLMGSQMTMTSMGDLSQGLASPNGPIRGGGVVTAIGSAPPTLRVPRHRFQTSPFAGLRLCPLSLVQITTMLVVDAPYQTATLRPGDGPGSFTWCPDAVLGCPATGPPNGGARNGRIV